MLKRLLFAILIITSLAAAVNAQEETVDLYMFYGQGCPYCAKLELFLDKIQPDYPNLKIHSYEIYSNDNNRRLFFEMADAFDAEIKGIPVVFIDSKVISGFNDAIGEAIEAEIIRCSSTDCQDPGKDIITITGNTDPTEDPSKTDLKNKLTLPAVISAAAVDAINPCAFAVLILLLTAVLSSGSRRRSLYAGLAFSASIFISYFLMGVGLYSAVQAAGVTRIIYTVVAVLAILVGLFNLKDYFWYGKWFVMEVPIKWRPRMKAIVRGVTSVPGAFLVGFVVSLFLLPCTSGPYIVILGLLAETTTRNSAMLWLLLYNFVFVLPMLIITLAIFFGFTTTEKAEQWRQRKLKLVHLIAGIIILLLGIGMLIALKIGII